MLPMSTETERLPIGLGVSGQKEGRLVGGVVIGFEQVLAHENGIKRRRAHISDEPRQVAGDLGIGGLKGSLGRPDRLDLIVMDLDDIGRDPALAGLIDPVAGQCEGQE